MINALVGTKKQMTSTYDARGRRVGATVIEILPNLVTQVKTSEKDSYSAIQLGYGSKKSVNKPQLGLLKKLGSEQKVRWFKEVKTTDTANMNPGQEIKVSDIFSVGDVVKVTGTSKGKGFTGVVKRWGFAGGPKTHGQSDRHRAPGSIGSGTTPGRVFKGKKMAGHMGNETASVVNLEVVSVDKKNGLLTVKGGIPGAVGGILMITRSGKVKGYTAPPEEKIDEEEEAAAVSSQSSDEVAKVDSEETNIAEEVVQPAEVVGEVKEQSSDAEAMKDKENA